MFICRYFGRSSVSSRFEGRHLGILPSILGYVYYVTLISKQCFRKVNLNALMR